MPTELITTWGAALGEIAPHKIWIRRLVFGVAEGLLLVLLLLDFKIRDKFARKKAKDDGKNDPGTTPMRKQCLTFGVAAAAFALWALGSAGTPLNDVASRTVLGIAVAYRLVLPRIVVAFDLALPEPK